MREKGMLLLAVLLAYLKVCSSTGNIEVHFVRYADTCKEDFGLECEPYFKFCLSRPQTGSLSVSRSSCHYGYASSNGHFHGSEQIDLLHLTNILGLSNPWSVKVLKFYDPEIMLAMDVYDKDKFTRDDHLVRFGMKLRLNVSHSKSVAEWERVTMFAHNSKYEHRLDFKIRIYCDENYYSPSCFVNCKAQDNANGHYTCDQKTGSKICKEGWTGENCNEDRNECKENVCHRGNCTNLQGSFKCDCPKGSKGKVCEDIEDPCLSEPCLNGGHCFSLQELPPKFICLCAEGWDGLYCSVKQDPCDDYPCQNMGICMSYNAKTSYSCNCSYPYTGAHCERVLTTTIAATTTATTVAPDTTSIIVPSITKAKLTTTVASSSTTVKRPDSDSFTTEGFRTTENYEEPSTEDNSQGQPSSTASTTKPIEGPQEENDGRMGAYTDSSSDIKIPVWLIFLTCGLALLVLVLLIVIFMIRRRKESKDLSRSTSVSFDRDNIAFTDHNLHIANEGGRSNPPIARMPEAPRQLPPVPVSPQDQGQGAIGGCNLGLSESCVVGVSKRFKPGRAEPNTYADIRTLSQATTVDPDLPEEEAPTPEESHYSTLDEVNSYDIVKDGNSPEYSVPRSFDYELPRNVTAQMESFQRQTSSGAMNPLYTSMPSNIPCSVDEIIPPARLQT